MISNLREDEQHKHCNGHGWVANTARVADSVFVGPHALVYGQAELRDRVCVVDSAQVSGHAVLSGDVIVSGNAWVSGTMKASTGRIWKNERLVNKAERIR
jgi:carbonic anhydrase/acetyltransferase-like protein (isoleucine patch superfamily)